jgi:hypothetical protein
MLGYSLQANNLGQREHATLIKVANVRRIKFHGLRHTSATLLYRRARRPRRQRAARSLEGVDDDGSLRARPAGHATGRCINAGRVAARVNVEVSLRPMSGRRRLAVFLSILWVVIVAASSKRGFHFHWHQFLFAGLAPIGFLWGVGWVVEGFRRRR